jgi:Cof subfamily protein (haloacid dehalogenase superfamily)
MTIKLIASDMDGTFLRTGDVYDVERFQQLLDKLAARDIKFVAASGRQILNLKEVFAPVIAKGYQIDYVGTNGARVEAQGRSLKDAYLSLEQIAKVIEWNAVTYAKMENLIIMVGDKHTYLSNHATPEMIAMAREFYPNVKQVDKLMEVDDHIFTVTFNWPLDAEVKPYVDNLRRVFGDELHATGSGFGSVDVLPKRVNKAVALGVLQEHYGIADDEVVVFGDNENDLEMLHKYANAYVMPNAEPFMHAQIKQQAFATNDEDGVIKTIEALID